MKKIISITLCLLLLSFALLLFFTSCSHEHTFGEWATVLEPTCIAEGRLERSCECGEKQTEGIPMIEHEKGEWVVTLAPTCTEEGTRERVCVCGEKEIETLSMIAHSEDWQVVVAPTCTESGTREYVCSCGKKETETLAALDHKTSSWQVDVEATVFGKGSQHTYCTRCNVTLKTEELPQVVSQGLEYEVNADGTTCTITGRGSCMSPRIGIPTEIDGYKVTAIGNNVNWDSEWIQTVDFFVPEGVLYIGGNAIPYRAERISIPNSIMSVGYTQLYEYKNQYDNAYYLGNEENPYLVLLKAKTPYITSCEIHENTKIIGYRAFYSCEELIDISIPTNVKIIREDAFCHCYKLENVTFHVGLEIIESTAFFDCPSIKSIVLPETLKSIGTWSFDAAEFEELKIPNSLTQFGARAFGDLDKFIHEYGNAYYVGSDENPYMILYKAKNEKITSCDIHKDTKVVYFEAFDGCTKLKSIELPEGLVYIDSYAFAATSLEEITIPNGVQNIGIYCFVACKSLKTVALPGNMETIPNGLFDGCEVLETVNIPKGVSAIGQSAFASCKNLKEVNIPEGVTILTSNVFANCQSISNINLHSKITHIDDGAFYRCTGLKGITIPESVIRIGRSAFAGCENLVYVDILGDLEYIGGNAFSDCKNLIKVTLPNNIERMEGYIFEGCDALALNEYESGLYLGTKENPYFMLLGVKNVPGLSFEAHPDVKVMSTSAFKNCSSVESISLPAIIDSIDIGMFTWCKGLKSLTIPKTVTYIDYSPFVNCENLKDIYYLGSQYDWIKVHRFADWDKGLSNYTIHYTN